MYNSNKQKRQAQRDCRIADIKGCNSNGVDMVEEMAGRVQPPIVKPHRAETEPLGNTLELVAREIGLVAGAWFLNPVSRSEGESFKSLFQHVARQAKVFENHNDTCSK